MKFALIALAILTPAFAQAKDINLIEKEWNACLESDEGQSTYGMLMCNGNAYDAADAELNAQYQLIVKDLKKNFDAGNKETLQRLVTAQRAWIAFRDAECSLQGTSMLGGTGENVVITGCQASTVIKRVKDLSELFAIR